MKRSKPLQRRTRVKARNAKRGGHRFPKTVDEDFRAWVRTQPCCVTGLLGVHAAHVRSRGAGGADRENLVPLVPELHRELDHQLGRDDFEKKYKVNLATEAVSAWQTYERERGNYAW